MAPLPPGAKEQAHDHLNKELRDVISILTGLGRAHHGGADDPMGIITLTGANKGAAMKMEGPEAAGEVAGHRSIGEGVEAFVNSNFQTVNNSIVIGGSCGAEDPGVQVVFQEEEEGEREEHHEKKKDKKKKKGRSEEEGRHGESGGEGGAGEGGE